MKLKERMPICESLIERMKEITEIEVNKLEGPLPILSLIKKEIHKKFVECDEDSSVVVSFRYYLNICFQHEGVFFLFSTDCILC